MRVRHLGIPSALLLLGSTLSAQTPTPGPTPTPTPVPAPIYVSDPALANTVTTGNQRRASVAVGADDNYLIVWNSDAAQAGFYDIKGQLFTRDGVKIGGEFQVDEAGPNRLEYTPNVASDGLGNYVVVWADFNQTVTDSEVYVRRYDGAANPLGGSVQVNVFSTGPQRLPRVAADSIGQFVVVWESQGQDGDGLGVFARQFDETGSPVGGDIAVNTYTTGNQDRASVDMDDQGYTVVFNDGNTGVAAREFGTFLGAGTPQFPVFGPSHRFGDVARLGGVANSFFVAENTTTQSIDGIRTVNGVAQSPFPAVSRGFNPRLARRRPAVPFAESADGEPSPEAWLAWEKDVDAYVQKYGLAGQRLVEEEAFLWWGSATIPDVDTSANGQVAVGAQNSVAAGSDVNHAHGGMPEPIEMGPDPTDALNPFISNDLVTILFSHVGMLALQADLANYQLTVPAGASLLIDDSTASFGDLPPGVPTSCLDATGDCYKVTPEGPRPGTHWDEAVVETLSTGVHKTWTLHIGQSFADVPTTNLFYKFIETLLHNGVTAGGACGGYCPTDGVKRQQMAVFLLKSRFGSTFVPPPATGTIFTDVPLSNPFAAWIETLFLLGVTGGCSGGPPPAPTQFCPDAIVNRQQMAVFLLKTLEGSSYLPPDAAGIFQDLPAGNVFAPWAEDLYARQITGGCVVSPLQYCPTNPTNRQQMAAFLVKTFGLLLYGP